MEFKHTSVLLRPTVEGLNVRPDGIYVDGTLGGGGHASFLCGKLSPEGTLIGIDRDRDALAAAEEVLKDYPCRKIFVQSNYSDIKRILDENGYENYISIEMRMPERSRDVLTAVEYLRSL